MVARHVERCKGKLTCHEQQDLRPLPGNASHAAGIVCVLLPSLVFVVRRIHRRKCAGEHRASKNLIRTCGWIAASDTNAPSPPCRRCSILTRCAVCAPFLAHRFREMFVAYRNVSVRETLQTMTRGYGYCTAMFSNLPRPAAVLVCVDDCHAPFQMNVESVFVTSHLVLAPFLSRMSFFDSTDNSNAP